MKPFTYLIINFLTIIICFLFSFHPKIQFNRKFVPFLKAAFLVLIPFVIWDVWFEQIGVWWFNDKYLLGFWIFNLPIEEWLFFICIPFSCVFTYFCLDKFGLLKVGPKSESILIYFLLFAFLIGGIALHEYIYTCFTLLSTALSLLFFNYSETKRWIGNASLTYLILMLGFIPVNGVLTGTGLQEPIVNYNPEHFLNIRLLTIPVEDIVYGFELFLWNVYFFRFFSGNSKS